MIPSAVKHFVGHYAIVGRDMYTEFLFDNDTDKYVTYFTIMVLADSVSGEDPVLATSRNAPYYLSQGSLNSTSRHSVDWVAFQSPDGNAYAIINARLFDLRAGRLILAFPQKDGSIRFYQTDATLMNSEERASYINDLKTANQVLNFVLRSGNI